MKFTPRLSGAQAGALTLAAGLAIAAMAAAASFAQSQYMVSQKGREFHPKELSVKRGESVSIVNDDADLLHHLYIDSPQLKYDSGDQGPGKKVDIAFPAAGAFEVLCAIHPKMKLVVQVK